jgi:hypothetical protein
MGHMYKIILCMLLLMIITSGRANVFAQSVPDAPQPMIDCEGTIRAWELDGYYRPGDCHCENGQPVCSKSSSGGKASGKKYNVNQEIKMQIAGTIFQSLLTSMFTTNNATDQEVLAAQQKAAALSAQQAAAWQRAKDAAFQAEHHKMMGSFKQLDGSQEGVAFKGVSDSGLGFKTLDDDMETLAANARKPFDTAGDMAPPVPEVLGGGTPFFGDTMPIEDIQLLVNPDNDPRVVDLRDATTYVAENIKNDSPNLAESTKPYDGDGNGEPIIEAPDCVNLAKKLNGFINQRKKFQKTINLSQEQYATWKNANRNALLNAAKDGLEYFTGQLLERLSDRAKAADRLQQIYEKNARQMAKEGLNIAEIEAKIKRLRMLSSADQIAELTSNMSDWQTFMKDGISGLLNQLTSSNSEIEEMLQDPNLQKYFGTESPELSALLDISKIAAANKVFGKWVAKKIPLIAGIELAINQSYNALDWYLSFTHIVEANKINGQVMNSARSLQKHIDDTYLALRECP